MERISWRALKKHVDSLTVNGQLIDAARNREVSILTVLLDKHENTILRPRPTRLHRRGVASRATALDDFRNWLIREAA